MKIRIYSFLFFSIILALLLTVFPPHFKGVVSEPGISREETPLLTAEIQTHGNSDVVVDCTPLNLEEYTHSVSKIPTETAPPPKVATPSLESSNASENSYFDAPGAYPESRLLDQSETQTPTSAQPTENHTEVTNALPAVEEYFSESFLNESPMIDKAKKNTFRSVSSVAALNIIPRTPGINGRSIYSPREHYVEDGDTLQKIAARYLRDENRYMEIFNLNQNLLNDPELLPIGCALQIPDLY